MTPLTELIGDIRDCASRAKDLGFPKKAHTLEQLAFELSLSQERTSSPPPAAKASFAEARAILRRAGLIK